MTHVQWLFHYKESIKEIERQNEIVEIITNYMELVGAMANPSAGKALKEAKELAKAKAEIPEDKFAEHFEEIKKYIPEKIVITKKVTNDNKYILPKYKRQEKAKLGINIKGGEE